MFMGLVKAGNISEGSQLDVADTTPTFLNEAAITWLLQECRLQRPSGFVSGSFFYFQLKNGF